MNLTKRFEFWLVFVLSVVAFLSCSTDCKDCDDNNDDPDGGEVITQGVCGPCGSIAFGDSTISANPQLDGVFKAVGIVLMSADSIRADLDARVKRMAGIFGIDVSGMDTDEIIAEIALRFDAQINTHLVDGVQLSGLEPECSVDIEVASRALTQCEAQMGCEVDLTSECDSGELSYACSGICRGHCDGDGDGSCTSWIDGQGACIGTCVSGCDLSASPGVCEGTCHGSCSGTCSNETPLGECAGVCSGDCIGYCAMPAEGGSCSGECVGQCASDVSGGDACEGVFEGECAGMCTGWCHGGFDPPSCTPEASAQCDAHDYCVGQARSLGAASLKCMPPSLNLSYELNSTSSLSQQAEAAAKLEAFTAEMVFVVQGMHELRSLTVGYTEDGVIPAAEILMDEVQEKIQAVMDGDLEVQAVGLLPCVIPALEESGFAMTNLSSEVTSTLDAQEALLALISDSP